MHSFCVTAGGREWTIVADDAGNFLIPDEVREQLPLGTALKPGWEPIVLARKPLIGTVAANVLAHGTGALNIDGCRIPATTGDEPLKWETPRGGIWTTDAQAQAQASEHGRWPANLMHDGSPEVVAQFPQEAGAAAPVAGNEPSALTNGIFGERERVAGDFYADSGSAARFFYCAKAGNEDREAGLREAGLREAGLREAVTDDGRKTPIDNPFLRGETTRRNTHPTVKPVDLMRWLCRLITPPGGTVLDPFMGSGSTGKAALGEGFRFIGIEAEAEYVAIARARCRVNLGLAL